MKLIINKKEEYIMKGEDIELYINMTSDGYKLTDYTRFLNYARNNLCCGHFDDIYDYKIISHNAILVIVYPIEIVK